MIERNSGTRIGIHLAFAVLTAAAFACVGVPAKEDGYVALHSDRYT
jgi:hypothetical protein